MTATLRDRLREQLANLKMPGALEALDEILRRADSGHAGETEGAQRAVEFKQRHVMEAR